MRGKWLTTLGACAFLAIFTGSSVHAQHNPSGKILGSGMSHMFPLVFSTSSNPGVPRLKSEAWLGATDLSDVSINPKAGDILDISGGPTYTPQGLTGGDAIVFVDPASALEIFQWLRDDPNQQYDYLIDVTAVEYREPERPLEVVYFLFSLKRKVQLCVKIALPKDGALEVDSVVPIWRGADWLEREVFDLFGITFRGHPDLRRILMWETYAEGHPLRKDFPLRGRFSRAEQTRQALHANPEAHYSLEELSIAEALGDLPEDMIDRLAKGERAAIPEAAEPANDG